MLRQYNVEEIKERPGIEATGDTAVSIHHCWCMEPVNRHEMLC